MIVKPAEVTVKGGTFRYYIEVPSEREPCRFERSCLSGKLIVTAVVKLLEKTKPAKNDSWWVGFIQTIYEDEITLHYSPTIKAVVRSFVNAPKDMDLKNEAIDPKVNFFEVKPRGLQPLVLGENKPEAELEQVQGAADVIEGRDFAQRAHDALLAYEKFKLKDAPLGKKLFRKAYKKQIELTGDRFVNGTDARVVTFIDEPTLRIPWNREVFDPSKPKGALLGTRTGEQKAIGFKDPVEGKANLQYVRGETLFGLWLVALKNGVEKRIPEGIDNPYPFVPVGPQSMGEFAPLYHFVWKVDYFAEVKGENVTPKGHMTLEKHGPGQGPRVPTFGGEPATKHVGVSIIQAPAGAK